MELKITDTRAAEIQARLDKYGNRALLWEAHHTAIGSGVHIDDEGDGPTIVATTCRLDGADAELIAPAPRDLADLLSDRAVFAAEIERLRAENERNETNRIRVERHLLFELKGQWHHTRCHERYTRRLKKRAERAERQLQAAEKVVEAARGYFRKRHGRAQFDFAVMDYDREWSPKQARQAPESAPGRDLQEGVATHMAGEAT